MKFMHISDLHLGKRLNEFSMLEDQEHILDQILDIAAKEDIDAVIIAGDVYDKPIPPAEAVKLFDKFITSLSDSGVTALIISGNHDSAERVAFGSSVMRRGGIYFSPVYSGSVEPVVLNDEYGAIYIYLLPFLKPANVRRFFPDAEIETHNDALAAAIGAIETDPAERNVIVSHQFVTGAVTSESEELSVGGLENVDAALYDKFDYTALGHIHRPQSMEGGRIRYCGTPLKYSFSEANDEKSVTIVDIKRKGDIEITKCPLKPLHDLREIRGTYDELADRKSYTEENRHDYIRAVLTDETEIPRAMDRLRAIYPNIMQLAYDNTSTRTRPELSELSASERRTPMELAADFYRSQNGTEMTEEQAELVRRLFDEIKEAEQ